MTITFAFTDSERTYLREMRALSTDAQGREVLVGLTFEETAFYVTYERDRIKDISRHDDGEKHLELHGKHERSRLSVLGAEIQLRNDKPPRH
jgi:hypothetical protein